MMLIRLINVLLNAIKKLVLYAEALICVAIKNRIRSNVC